MAEIEALGESEDMNRLAHDESRGSRRIRPEPITPLREADECVRRYVISPGAFAVDSRTTNSGSIAISEG